MICPICDGVVYEWIDDGYSHRICIEGHFEVRQGFMGAHIKYGQHTFFLDGGRDNGGVDYVASLTLDRVREEWFKNIKRHNWKEEGF